MSFDQTSNTAIPQDFIAPTSQTTLFDLSQLLSLLEAGGPVIAILMGLSIIVVTVFLLKCWQFFRLGIGRYKVVYGALLFWQNNNPTEALKALKVTPNPMASVLSAAMTLKNNHSDEALAREETLRIAKRELANLRSHLKIVEVIATLSPLLGLLGTVLGMISAFQKLQGAGSTIDPALLSGGIWEALLTTAAGLIVAIPAVVALHWLEQRIERFKLVMEDAMTQVFTVAVKPAINRLADSETPAKYERQAQKVPRKAPQEASPNINKKGGFALAT